MATVRGSERDAARRLVERGVLTACEISQLEARRAAWGAGPVEAALALGLLRPEAAAAALAEAAGLANLDPAGTRFDHRLTEAGDLPHLTRGKFLPWARREQALVIAVVNPYTAAPEIDAWLGAETARILEVTTEAILTSALVEAHGAVLVEQATYGLSDRCPHLSARGGASAAQIFAALAFAGLASAAFVAAPATSFLIASLASGIFFIGIMLFRLIVMAAGARLSLAKRAPSPIAESALPIYTILVPLRDEAALLPHLVAALKALDYPATKLDILLLLEASDSATLAACRHLDLDARFRVITVPDRRPRTKPKACNFGLSFARGDYVVTYDAEDHPNADQLLRALDVLRAEPETSCVQAQLFFFNATENWLTEQFALEFALWFGFLLPGLARLGLPVPLGGTSNHFSRARLEEIGGWDAFNVTEDADIGIRIARSRGRVRLISSATAEEANCEVPNWLHQRSRWLKGYLQTWLVHMRSPLRLVEELGIAGFLAFQLLVGGALVAAFLHLVFWGMLVGALLSGPIPGWALPGWLWPWSLAVLAAGNGTGIACGIIAALHPRFAAGQRLQLILSALSMPLYWFLISFAVIKAMFSFVSRPFYWAKTRHGLTRIEGGIAKANHGARRGPWAARSGQP